MAESRCRTVPSIGCYARTSSSTCPTCVPPSPSSAASSSRVGDCSSSTATGASSWSSLGGRANTERFFKAASPAFKTPEIGRILRREVLESGFEDVEVRIQAGADTTGGSLAVLHNMASYAGTFDAMPAAEIARLLAEAEAAVDAERYLFSLPQFVVTGRRP